MQKLISFFMVFIVVLLAGCADTSKQLPYQGENAAYIYQKGHDYLQDGNYNSAEEAFQSLNAQYPFEKYAQMGSLESLYAYYKNDEPAMVIAMAERYINNYPSTIDTAYAYYMKGVAQFENGKGFLQRYFPYDMSKHDISGFQQAYSSFDTVVRQYPTSKYAPDARRRMMFLKNNMALFEYRIADYYFKREAYVAAINRAKVVLLNYPKTPAVEDALVLIVKSYDHLKLVKLAQTNFAVLKTNFPNNKFVKSRIEKTKVGA